MNGIPEIRQSFEQPLNSPLHVVPIEVIRAQVLVFHAVAKHVPRGSEHGRRNSDDCFFGTAPRFD